MNIRTGQTVYEQIISLDSSNNPVSAATFNSTFYINGTITSQINPSISLSNASAGTFTMSWSASSLGYHQAYVKNNSTNVIYVSELYNVLTDVDILPSPTIYVGL